MKGTCCAPPLAETASPLDEWPSAFALGSGLARNQARRRYTDDGVAMSIEVAYTSCCEAAKIDGFATLAMPALEIDLRAFTPDGFDAEAVKVAILESVVGKA